SQVAMIVFSGAMVPIAEPTSSQQSGAGKTDLVEMRDGSQRFGRVSSVSANLVVQNGTQLPRSSVGVIEFDVSPPIGYVPAEEKPPASESNKPPSPTRQGSAKAMPPSGAP